MRSKQMTSGFSAAPRIFPQVSPSRLAGEFPAGIITIVTIALLAVFALGGCASGPALDDPRTMHFPTLPLAPPQPRRVVLENGLVLFLLRDPEVPLVTVQALVRTGAVLEPADKVDLAEITGRVMRTGGTARHTGPELNLQLESLGASLETGIGRQSASASLSVLAPDLAVGIELLAEVLRTPVFDPTEVERVKRRKIEEIRRGNDEPDAVAFREFRTAVYGDDPRGRQSSPRWPPPSPPGGSRRLSRALVSPRPHDARRQRALRRGGTPRPGPAAFRRLAAIGPAGPGLPGADAGASADVFFAAKEVPQATLVMGHLAPPKNSADFFVFSVLDHILGGSGFSSAS